jgi:glycosyltransferase involved in cell wall biosynthesis
MRIVLGIERYWPATGGAENYVRAIAHGLSERHEVTVVSLVRDDCQRSPICGCVFAPWPGKGWDGSVEVVHPRLTVIERLNLVPAMLQIVPLPGDASYRLLREWAFARFQRVLLPYFVDLLRTADVVHTVAPWEISHTAALAAKQLGVRHIITGLMHPGYWADDRNSVQLFKACDKIIALADAEQAAYCAAGIEPDHIKKIEVPAPAPNRCDPATFRINYPVGRPMVLYVGAKRWYKGCDLLLDAAPHLWRDFPDATFVFIGPSTRTWRRIISRHQDPRIIDLDWVPENIRDAAFAAADVVCLPSRTEIAPNVILEAWAAKKPVIVSDIPTLREMVSRAGVTVPLESIRLAEAIGELVRTPDLSAKLAAEGFRRINEELSRDRIVERLEEVYAGNRD